MAFIAILELGKRDVIKVPFRNSFTRAQRGFAPTEIVTNQLIEY